jgi:6,7-dimethyl-8-ribityllumazine synthase
MARKQVRVGIVCSRFNEEITSRMKDAAIRAAKEKGAKIMAIVDVPGAFEIPLAADRLLARKDIDAVAAVGTVIKGETRHDEVITFAICKTLLEIQLRRRKPIGLGISGPGITEDQARERAEGYAQRAICAALELAGNKG